MRKIFVSTIMTFVILSAFTAAFAQKEKSKEEAFKEIVTLSNSKSMEDKAKAYELSKDFLKRFAKDKDKDKNVQSVKKFTDNYRIGKFYETLDAKKFPEAFALGKEILADEPDNTEVLMNLGYAGYQAMVGGDKSYAEVSIGYAQKTLDLLGKGMFPKSYAPFPGKEGAIAFMYFSIGNLNLDRDLKMAVSNIYKSTLYESQIKENSHPYYLVASYYEERYQQETAALKAKVDAKLISDADYKAGVEKNNQIMELMMDAYARAYKKADAEKSPAAIDHKNRLTVVYKFMKKTDAGLEEFINYTVGTPFKDPTAF